MESKEINNELFERSIRKGYPGFGEAFTEKVLERLNKIRPLTHYEGSGKKQNDLAKLQYSVLVAVTKKEKPKIKLPITMEVRVVTQEQFENELLKLKLLELKLVEKAGDEFEITDLGRRFMRDFEHKEQTEK